MRTPSWRATALMLTALAAGGAALTPAPADAQSGRTDYENTPPYTGVDTFDHGYQGRTAMAGDRYGVTYDRFRDSRYGGTDDRSRDDRYGREQFDRGYRSGRDDERRMSGRSGSRNSAAMEFLDHARQQIDQGDLRAAWVSLGRAETRLLTRSVPSGAGQETRTSAAVGAIRAARQALRDRDADLAEDRTERATDLARRDAMMGRYGSGASSRGVGMSGRGEWMSGGDRIRYSDRDDDWND